MTDHTTTITRLRELAAHVEPLEHLRLRADRPAPLDDPPEGAVEAKGLDAPDTLDGFNMAYYAAGTECGTVGCLAGHVSTLWPEDAGTNWWGFASGIRALRLNQEIDDHRRWAEALFVPPFTFPGLEKVTPEAAAFACRRLADLLTMMDAEGQPWSAHTDAPALWALLWQPHLYSLYLDERSPA